MQVVVPMDGGAHLAGGHRFAVNLVARKGQSAQVRSCEVIGLHHRNRFSFPSRVTVDDVFVHKLADGIRQCLSSLSYRTEAVSLPTVSIEIPGLALAEADVIATKGEDGTVAIILRFKTFLGQVSSGFHPDLGIADSFTEHSGHMSATVLSDIVMPLLDLCSVAESGSFDSTPQFETFMETLIERSAEIRFQAELIKRFVASSGNTRPACEPYAHDRGKSDLATRG